MIPYGNVDTEMGGSGQLFPVITGSGNVQSDTAPVNYALGYGRNYPSSGPDPMQYYFELGQQLLQQQMAMQQQMAQRAASGQQGAPADDFNLQATPLTMGFDPNWLSQRLAAGSANGASIQKMSGGGLGGGSGNKRAPGDADHLPDAPSGTGFGDTPSTNMSFLGGYERLTR